ncbi:hypothetical protein BU61_9695 [Pontoporia blainvillei]|uniref:Uncharacterized protein n=1 Tax=Pontoporia blainvillei TaxID=48723 RepID=A0ABX0SB37_PONBL|nr:hypothetical protein [Pontoporia blainvillei]
MNISKALYKMSFLYKNQTTQIPSDSERENLDTLFPEGPQDLNANARAESRSPLTKRHPARPPAGPGQGASTLAAAGLRPDDWSPQRNGDPNKGSRWDSHLHNPPVLARLHASSAPPQDRCARPALVPPGAAERFPGDTGGRSPAVAKAVARARLSAGPSGKGNGRGGPRYGVRRKVPPQLLQWSVVLLFSGETGWKTRTPLRETDPDH